MSCKSTQSKKFSVFAKHMFCSYPYLSFDEERSSMIVKLAPTPLHESFGPILADSIHNAIMHLPESMRTSFKARTSQEYIGFRDNTSGTGKIPDLAVTFKLPNGNRELVLVLEVGFSQSWADVVRIATRWLEKTDEVKLVLIAKLTEKPTYSNPIRNMTNKELQPLELKSAFEIKERDFELEGEQGPVTFRGVQWVGSISECYIETWGKDSFGTAIKLGKRIVS